MRTQTLVVAGAAVAAAAAATSANTSPNPLVQVVKRQLQIGEECQKALTDSLDIVQSIPQPPTDPEFLEFLSGQTAPENLGECEFPSVTGDPAQASAYSSYISQVTQWVGENGDALLSLISVCSTEPVFSSALSEMDLPIPTTTVCSEYSFATGAASNPSSSGSDDDSSSETTSSGSSPTGGDSSETTSSESSGSGGAAESSGTESPGAAPRQTGMAVAAMAVAGFAVAGIY